MTSGVESDAAASSVCVVHPAPCLLAGRDHVNEGDSPLPLCLQSPNTLPAPVNNKETPFHANDNLKCLLKCENPPSVTA